MKEYNSNIVFSKHWFIANQQQLLKVLNVPLLKNIIIKRVLPFSILRNSVIVEIMPSYVIIQNTNSYSTYCFSKDYIANSIASNYNWLWKTIHFFDINIANNMFPALNMGFDTYNYYSESGSGTGNTVCDGDVGRKPNSYESYLNIIAGAGTHANDTYANIGISAHYYNIGDASGGYDYNSHGYITFEVPELIPSVTISSAKIYLWLYSTGDYNSWDSLNTSGFYAHIVESNTNYDNYLTTGDYLRYGSTSFASIRYSSSLIVGYNVFTLNSNGISYIDTGGNTTFAIINNFDLNKVEPNRSNDVEKINTSFFIFQATDINSSSQVPYLQLTIDGMYVPYLVQN